MLLLQEAMISKHKANSMTDGQNANKSGDYPQGHPLEAQVIGSLELSSFLQQMVLGPHPILGSCRAVSILLMFLEVPVLS